MAAVSTIKVYLYFGTSSASLSKLVDIKSYPDMIGAPELIDATTMSDEASVYIPGLQSQDVMSFTANYTAENWTAVTTNASTDGYYELRFGDTTGSAGIFEWQGQHTAGLTSGEVNAVAEMQVHVVPSTKVTKKTSSST